MFLARKGLIENIVTFLFEFVVANGNVDSYFCSFPPYTLALSKAYFEALCHYPSVLPQAQRRQIKAGKQVSFPNMTRKQVALAASNIP